MTTWHYQRFIVPVLIHSHRNNWWGNDFDFPFALNIVFSSPNYIKLNFNAIEYDIWEAKCLLSTLIQVFQKNVSGDKQNILCETIIHLRTMIEFILSIISIKKIDLICIQRYKNHELSSVEQNLVYISILLPECKSLVHVLLRINPTSKCELRSNNCIQQQTLSASFNNCSILKFINILLFLPVLISWVGLRSLYSLTLDELSIPSFNEIFFCSVKYSFEVSS